MTLITRERAQRNINQSTFTTAENRLCDSLIAAVSQAIEQHCRRRFQAQQHDELHRGDDEQVLVVKHYPILAVLRVAYNPETMLTIQNTSALNQVARVQVTTAGLTLTRIASGTVAIDSSITFASYTTLASMATAVAALGNGWTATVTTGYGNHPSIDLRALQGAFDAKNRAAELKMHIEDLGDYEVCSGEGILYRELRFTRGEQYRVVYTAGYETVPEDVQEAAAEWVSSLFWQAKNDPAVHPSTPTRAVVALLAPYVKRSL